MVFNQAFNECGHIENCSEYFNFPSFSIFLISFESYFFPDLLEK